jgi:hypothetical protein
MQYDTRGSDPEPKKQTQRTTVEREGAGRLKVRTRIKAGPKVVLGGSG